MRTHAKRKRSMRARALAAFVLALLAVPAASSAMLPPPDPPSHHGSAVATLDGSAPQPVRDVRTVVTGRGDQTVAIVLGAAALAVALGGAGYVALRVRPMLRS